VKKNLKIGSYLTKLLVYKNFVLFFGRPCRSLAVTEEHTDKQSSS